jgi:hypothetical protein
MMIVVIKVVQLVFLFRILFSFVNLKENKGLLNELPSMTTLAN